MTANEHLQKLSTEKLINVALNHPERNYEIIGVLQFRGT